MKNKILVTGGHGLVGSEFLGTEYYKPTSKKFDLRNVDDSIRLMLKRFDGVIHCAGKVGGVGSNLNYKGQYFYDNIMINTNVIESAKQTGVKNLVAFLSTCIFPDKVEYPLTENKIQLGPPHHSNDAYAYAKRMTDIQM